MTDLRKSDRVELWVNLRFACGLVVIDDRGWIVDTMPILSRFIGQPLANLIAWPPYIEHKVLAHHDTI